MAKFSRAALVLVAALSALLLLGFWYANDRGVPPELVPVLIPAVLLEITLYFVSGTKAVRERAEELPPGLLATALTLTAPLSWLAYTVPLGLFSFPSFLSLLGMGVAASFWYLVFGRRPIADGGFLLLLALPILLEVFKYIYPSPVPRVPMHVLGAMMWYRTGLIALLTLRRMDGIGFGFLPSREDWGIGLRNFLWFLPAGLGLASVIGFIRLKPFHADVRTLLIAVATFVGVLWVLAVAEEFFFRGMVQQELTRILGSDTAGLLLASCIFGAAHLGSGEFPNWRFASVATVAGLFYGRAYIEARNIRASMVTHACVVTVWKVFLS